MFHRPSGAIGFKGSGVNVMVYSWNSVPLAFNGSEATAFRKSEGASRFAGSCYIVL
jgi:hypothetical protein